MKARTTMKQETHEKLMQVSVATLATALYKRGLRNQVIQVVNPVPTANTKPPDSMMTGRRSRVSANA